MMERQKEEILAKDKEIAILKARVDKLETDNDQFRQHHSINND